MTVGSLPFPPMTSALAAVVRRAVDRIRQRDPELDALRRARAGGGDRPIGRRGELRDRGRLADTALHDLRVLRADGARGLSRQPANPRRGLRRPGHQRGDPHHAGHRGGAARVALCCADVSARGRGHVLGRAQRDDRGRTTGHPADVRAARRAHRPARSTSGCWVGPSRWPCVFPPRCSCCRRATTESYADTPQVRSVRWPTASRARPPAARWPTRCMRCGRTSWARISGRSG